MKYSGGQIVQVSDPFESLDVKLPEPGSYITLVSGTPGIPGAPPVLSICYLEANAKVEIDVTNGQEISRNATSGAGDHVIDQILAGVHVGPGQSFPVPVRPPKTGDGGLR